MASREYIGWLHSKGGSRPEFANKAKLLTWYKKILSFLSVKAVFDATANSRSWLWHHLCDSGKSRALGHRVRQHSRNPETSADRRDPTIELSGRPNPSTGSRLSSKTTKKLRCHI